MARSIESMPTFVYGVILVTFGLALVVSELTSLGFGQTGSVAGLAGGAVVLVAAIIAPRGRAEDEPVFEESSEPVSADDV